MCTPWLLSPDKEAESGGIGANRANPGRYWFANLAMGTNVLEQARVHSTPKLVIEDGAFFQGDCEMVPVGHGAPGSPAPRPAVNLYTK